MACQVVDPGNPYLWLLITGCLLGITAAQAAIPPPSFVSPRRGRTDKWTWFYIFASFSVAAALAGFFIPGWKAYASKDMIWYGGIVFFVSAVAFRFKKAAGITVVFLLLGFIVYFGFITAQFSCSGGQPRLAWFRVLEYGEDGTVRAEAENGGDTAIYELTGEGITPVVSVLSVSSKYILYGGRTLYIFNGIYPERVSVGGKEDLSEKRIRRFARRLPGIEYRLLSVEPFRPPQFQRYAVILQGGGSSSDLRIEPLF